MRRLLQYYRSTNVLFRDISHVTCLLWLDMHAAREKFNAKDPRNNLILVCRVKNQTVSSQTAALHSPADFYGNSV